jgi:DNA-binding transcriptional LysR family regulator
MLGSAEVEEQDRARGSPLTIPAHAGERRGQTSGTPRHGARSSAPIDSAAYPFGNVVAEFRWRCPKVKVELLLTDERIDLCSCAIDVALTHQHLIQVHGHRHMLFVVGSVTSSDTRARYEGFRDALESAGLPILEPISAPAAMLAARAGAAGMGPRPDAFTCASDQDAIALIEGLSAIGIGVPHEVAVTGFDGILAGRLSRPTLTTVRQPMELMGRAAVEILLDRLTRPSDPPIHREFPVHLVT